MQAKIQPSEARFITENVRLHDTIQHRINAMHAGHSNKRYRWDCLWRAGLSEYICNTIYPNDCNDEHIDTVLRQAIPDLNQTTTKGTNHAS